MLSNNLNTNEIKNSAGAEVEFEHVDSDGRTRVFKQVTESYALPHRLSIKHAESGVGIKRVRRSAVRIDKSVVSTVDTSLVVPISFYTVAVIPIGALLASTEPSHVCAELGSFTYTTGAGTTVLFDGTGNGSVCLLQGSM